MSKVWKRGTLAVLAMAVLPFTLAACGDDDETGGGGAETTASGPVTLTVYSGREEELVAPLFERYEKETGNKLKVRYGDSAELASTIVEEGERSPADVFFSQDAGALGALQKDGRLAELEDEVLETVDERFRSDDGAWVGISGRVRVVAYDTRELSRSDLPDSILGFTDPRWKGRIAWAPTNASFQSFVTALREVEGEDGAERWLEGIQANEPQVLEKNSAIRDAIAAGEVEVGFINHYYVLQARAEEGRDYPVGIFFPPKGDVGALVNVAGAGVLESSDRAEAAAELVEFLLAEQSQEFFSEETKEYPLRDGVKVDSALPPLSSIEQPDVDLSDLDDLDGTLKLLEKTGAL